MNPLYPLSRWIPLVGFFISAFASQAAAQPTRPNILFIAIDDLRPELGCYGDSEVRSPHIDRLAENGLLFSRAYCQVPVCGASRASLMTSILPTPERFPVARTHAEEDAPGAKTLPQVLREAGYTTISNGKIFHFRDDTAERSWSEPPWHCGFTHMTSHDPVTTARRSSRDRGLVYEAADVPDNAYPDGMTAEKTMADLRRLKAAGKPFFLGCGFIRPHLPFYAPKRYWDLYDRDEIAIADNRSRPQNAPAALRGSKEFTYYHHGDYESGSEDFDRMMRHGYYAATSYADKLTGDVLGELERLGLADNTIVVIWGDHGWQLGEHTFWGKHNTMHPSLRVPLIIKVPGKTRGGTTDALVANLDLFPTLCALSGVEVPKTVQGKSVVALFDDPDAQINESVYSRYGSGDAVVTDHFVYTSYGDAGEMLYDHRIDPKENVNRAGDPAYAQDLQQMRRFLAEQQRRAASAQVPPPSRKNNVTPIPD